ncbi:MAG TPA: zf-HC2 domain-containing protein [Blastocatellia bacterium]|nr:zf-HC2 domain-containing protein [Blastocatellia bacterium]
MRQFCDRSADITELVWMAEHLGTCEKCIDLFRFTFRAKKGDAPISLKKALSFDWLKDEHYDYDQLIAHLEDAPELDDDDREMFELHLSMCRNCREDFESLRRFSQEIEPELLIRYSPPRKSSTKAKLLANWYWATMEWRPRLALSAAILIIVASITLLIFQRERKATAPSPAKESVKRQNSTSGTGQIAEHANIEDSEIVLRDSDKTISLQKDGNISGVENITDESTTLVRNALIAQSLAQPGVLNNVISEKDALRGIGTSQSDLKLISPVGVVIVEQRPRFRWRKLKDATSYRIEIADTIGHEIAKSPELSSSTFEWIPSHQLKRGGIYSWQVVATVNGKEIVSPRPPTAEARFKVLDRESLDQLNQLKQATQSHLALGVFYAHLGLIPEAEKELEALVRENPDSPIALKLLHSVQSWR